MSGREAAMNVNLTPELERWVRAKVASGMYNNASEVVREALRTAAKIEARRASPSLEELLAEGVDDIESGRTVVVDDQFWRDVIDRGTRMAAEEVPVPRYISGEGLE
jgi:antitoxin ParD1/3/4